MSWTKKKKNTDTNARIGTGILFEIKKKKKLFYYFADEKSGDLTFCRR